MVSPGLLQLHTEAAGRSSNNMTALAVANKWERQWGLQDLAAVLEQEPGPDQSIAEGWQVAAFAMLQGIQRHKATYVRSDVCACGPELLQLTKNKS